MLSPALVQQIENAIMLLIDESGHGEVVIPISHGHPLDYIIRRPIVRMAIPRGNGAGPPPGGAIEYPVKSG